MFKIVKYVFIDLIRSRVVLGYAVLLFLVSLAAFNLEENPEKGVLSLMNLVMVIVPLVSIVFATIYLYNASEFIELMVSQPLKRKTLWISLFAGLSISMSIAFFVGCGLPILIFGAWNAGWVLVLTGLLVTVIFVALAMLSAVLTRDKAKGVGISIMAWFYFTVIYDAILLFILFQFMDYPMESAMLTLSMFNPLDLGRILILLKFDISVLMGATSTLFRQFFGMGWGMLLSAIALLSWLIFPYWISLRKFVASDL